MPTKILFQLRAGSYEAEITVPIHHVEPVRDDDSASQPLSGFHAIECAVTMAYQQLPWRIVTPENDSSGDMEKMAYVTLYDGGDVNKAEYFEDANLCGPEWLKEFVVKAEILEG